MFESTAPCRSHRRCAGYLDGDHLVVYLVDTVCKPIRALFGTTLKNAAWRSKPSWAIIPREDRAFGQGLLLGMARRIGATIIDVPGSHAAFITQSATIVDVIDRAARDVSQSAARATGSDR